MLNKIDTVTSGPKENQFAETMTPAETSMKRESVY